MELKIGQILKTNQSPYLLKNSIIQIVGKDRSGYHYIYLSAAGLNCAQIGCQINHELESYQREWEDFSNCTIINNHPNAGLVCQDCFKFCQQKCRAEDGRF